MTAEPRPLHIADPAVHFEAIARQMAANPEPPELIWEGQPFAFEPGPEDEQREIAGRMALAISHPDASPDGPLTWPEPEDRGRAVLSALGDVEYVEDLVRPGRILCWAAEEGSGKSYAVDAELGMRIAVAGGAFAGTWPILQTGPVLILSEMHPDDDYQREQTTLESLGLERDALAGRYYRLSLITAAGGRPALTVDAWRDWITAWLREHEALLLVVDTATGATQVDPWGKAIQEVYTNLRVMIDEYPALAVILLLHLKKPQGRGERRISDVLGEWGRWCDVVVIQENEGASLTQTKITTRKRV
ncbi:MAG TPA: AAA family ATPase, partial [Candidatus Limnocylindrales bacterium]|nr:AAA family ATPase [Candidatus Limnocylindrales bacterium]